MLVFVVAGRARLPHADDWRRRLCPVRAVRELTPVRLELRCVRIRGGFLSLRLRHFRRDALRVGGELLEDLGLRAVRAVAVATMEPAADLAGVRGEDDRRAVVRLA